MTDGVRERREGGDEQGMAVGGEKEPSAREVEHYRDTVKRSTRSLLASKLRSRAPCPMEIDSAPAAR